MGKMKRILARQQTNVRNQKEVIVEARNEGRKVLFASVMDFFHLKNSELEPRFQKNTGRIVFRGTLRRMIQDRSRTCSRRSIGVCPRTMEDAHKLLKIPKSECPDIWIRLPRHKWPKSLSNMEDPVVHLARNLYGRTIMGKAIWEHSFNNMVGRRFPIKNVFSYTVKKGYSCLWLWTKQLVGKKKILTRRGKYSRKTLIWVNQHHSLTKMFDPGFQLELWENDQLLVNRLRIFRHGPITWKVMQEVRGNISRTGNLFFKASTPRIDDHQFKRRKNGIFRRIVYSFLANFSEYLVLGSLLVDLFFLSLNKLARAITEWTMACEKCLARLISSVLCTNANGQDSHVENTAQQCGSGLFQGSDFAGDLGDSKSMSCGLSCIFGSRTFAPVSCMCKKQTSVSHSSTESEVISLDAGFTHGRNSRAWCLWLGDWSISFLTKPNQQIQRSGVLGKNLSRNTTPHKKNQIKPSASIWSLMMWSRFANVREIFTFLYLLSLLKTMRQWSRLTLKEGVRQWNRFQEPSELLLIGWYLRLTWTPKIQIRYTETKRQLADILTKSDFTCDEWTIFFILFNISHFCSFLLRSEFQLE